RTRHGARILRQGQLRRRRQRWQTTDPIFLGAPVRLRALKRGFCQDIVTKRDLKGRERRVRMPVQLGEFLNENLDAPRIEDQEIQADVQSGTLIIEESRSKLEQRPPIAVEHLV